MGDRLFSGGIESEWIPPTPEAIEAYHENYSQWIAGLKTFVADTPSRLAQRAVSVDLDLIICNEGVEPADDVIVSIETVGGFLLSQIERGEDVAEPNGNAPAKLEPYPGPPTPPEPVKKIPLPQAGGWPDANRSDAVLAAARAFGAPHLADRYRGLATRGVATPIIERFPEIRTAIHKPRDRHKFYWRDTDERDGVTRGSLNAPSFDTVTNPRRSRCASSLTSRTDRPIAVPSK